MNTTTPQATNGSNAIDLSALLALANKSFGKTVDWDMAGTPITDCAVLLYGAYGPAVMRLVNLAVSRAPALGSATGEATETGHGGAIDRAQLAVLAEVAFAEATDLDFGGNVITDYALVLQDEYGYGQTTLQLVNLAVQHAA